MGLVLKGFVACLIRWGKASACNTATPIAPKVGGPTDEIAIEQPPF